MHLHRHILIGLCTGGNGCCEHVIVTLAVVKKEVSDVEPVAGHVGPFLSRWTSP